MSGDIGDRPRICIVTSKTFIAPRIMDAFARAFTKRGCAVLSIAADQAVARQGELHSFGADLAFGYGSSAMIDTPAGPLFRTLGVRTVNLFYDCPFFIVGEHEIAEFHAHPDSYAHFIWDRTFLDAFRALNIAHAAPTLLAADPACFSPAPRRASYRFDVSFVGQLENIAELSRQRAQSLSPTANRLFDEILPLKLHDAATPLLSLWSDLAVRKYPEFAIDWRSRDFVRLYFHVCAEGSALLRMALLHSLDHEVHVFGPGWEGIGGSAPIIRHPAVDYDREAPGVYADSRINLNISSLQLDRSLNNRVFDVGAVAGLLLTDPRQDYADNFAGCEALIYRSPDQLRERIADLLTHEQERLAAAEKLHRAVLGHHTYDIRAGELLGALASMG